ncbi:MAG TPA: ATP-binding cassette domain-containing protein [Spirochaetota bacterium]
MQDKSTQSEANAAALVTLNNITVTREGRTILRDLSLSILRGHSIRILGGNGSGKTTLLRLIKGEINPDGGISPSRVYSFDNESTPSPIAAHHHVRFVSPAFQDRYRQKGWNLSGEEVIATGFDDTPILYRDLSDDERARISDLSSWLGIDRLLDRSILTMSRGEGRRVLIARALISSPHLLLLDEFLHELDPRGRREITDMIERSFEKGVTILYTGHRLEERVPSTTDEYKLCDGVLHRIDNHPAASAVPFKQKERISPVNSHSTEILFRLKRCSVFLENNLVIKEIDLSIDSSQNWAIIGGNGAGKSTLMRLLYGFHRPAIGGDIERLGVNDGELLHDAQSKIGFLSSEFQSRYDGECTASDVVLSGLRGSVGVYDEFSEKECSMAMELLARVGLSDSSSRQFSTFSYGEQRKILFARSLINAPRVLILDEPFAGIDAASREHLTGLIEDLSAGNIRIITSVHHAEDIPSTITHIIHLDGGRIAYAGKIEEFPIDSYMRGI